METKIENLIEAPIRELPIEFTKSGDKFTQVGFNETTRIYMYERVLKIDGAVYYEVFERKIGNAYKSAEKIVRYPTDECFGAWAKCCSTYKAAKQYFDNGI